MQAPAEDDTVQRKAELREEAEMERVLMKILLEHWVWPFPKPLWNLRAWVMLRKSLVECLYIFIYWFHLPGNRFLSPTTQSSVQYFWMFY